MPDAILARLQRLHPKIIDLSLGRLTALLAKLDHPERRLPPVIHIAGTNGKGSTQAMLAAMMDAAGYRAHRYISPHLIRFNERIVLNGEEIGDAALDGLLDRVEAANAGAEITFFEVTTAAAFLAFSETPADVLLLETGLGGRLDATNVVAKPAVTLISPISMDHASFLGPTIWAIAGEKAGIFKPGVPALIAEQCPPAALRLRQEAARRGAKAFYAGKDWQIHAASCGVAYRDEAGELSLPSPALAGPHQIGNAGLAIAAARRLAWPKLDATAIGQGLVQAKWPGRLQRLTTGKLPALVKAGDELWLDGGHNPAAGAALADFFRDRLDKPLILVVGMLDTKDNKAFLVPLAPLATSLTSVPVPRSEHSLAPEIIAATARHLGLKAQAATDLEMALSALKAEPNSTVLIAGSLYLAGAVLALNRETS